MLGAASIALSGLPEHRLGRYVVRLRVLDDATVARGEWDPGQTSLAARTAAADPTAIGYVGDLDSGASAVSIPLLSRAGHPAGQPDEHRGRPDRRRPRR